MVKDLKISREISPSDELLAWIERNLPKIKASGILQSQLENVPELLQKRIQALLGT